MEEVLELHAAVLNDESIEDVANEAADVANVAMMIANVYDLRYENKEETPHERL